MAAVKGGSVQVITSVFDHTAITLITCRRLTELVGGAHRPMNADVRKSLTITAVRMDFIADTIIVLGILIKFNAFIISTVIFIIAGDVFVSATCQVVTTSEDHAWLKRAVCTIVQKHTTSCFFAARGDKAHVCSTASLVLVITLGDPVHISASTGLLANWWIQAGYFSFNALQTVTISLVPFGVACVVRTSIILYRAGWLKVNTFISVVALSKFD